MSSSQPDDAPSAVQQIADMLRDRSIDGVVTYLHMRFRQAGSAELEDALLGAIDKIARKDYGGRRDMREYLSKAAARTHLDNLKLASNRRTVFGVDNNEKADPRGGPETELILAEAARATRDALERLLSLVGRWDNKKLAVVMELHLRTALDGEPLSAAEVAEYASDALDEAIDADAARRLKHRGVKRICAELGTDYSKFIETVTDEETT